jgi:hypothetical protein
MGEPGYPAGVTVIEPVVEPVVEPQRTGA